MLFLPLFLTILLCKQCFILSMVNNAQHLTTNFDQEFLECSPPISNPNEHSEYIVILMKRYLNEDFQVRHKTITQRRLHSPCITPNIMERVRKKHKWFKLLRNGLISYNFYKTYLKTLRLSLRTARKYYHVQRL